MFDEGGGVVSTPPQRRPQPPPNLHPGEGRGPVGKVVMTKDDPLSGKSPNWASAFAGVVARRVAPTPTCFPAKAGIQGYQECRL